MRQGIYLNKQLIEKERLKLIIYKFLKEYSPNYVIIYDVDDKVGFGKYIEYLDLIYYTIGKLRNDLSYQLFDQPYGIWNAGEKNQVIREKIPNHLIEWTSEEKRLNVLMGKSTVIYLDHKFDFRTNI